MTADDLAAARMERCRVAIALTDDAIARLRAGDDSALADLDAANAGLVRSVVRRYAILLGIDDADRKEDMAQECRLSLVRTARWYVRTTCDSGMFALWAARRMRRDVRDWFVVGREAARGYGAAGDGGFAAPDLAAAAGPGPADLAADRDEADAMLRRLPPPQREVVARSYGLAGRREEARDEIAVALGVTPGRISQIRIAALERLRATA